MLQLLQLFASVLMMPPKSRRRKNIEESLRRGRETKQRRANARNDTPSTDPMGLHNLFVLEDEALDTDSETVDPSFDPDVSMMSDTEHLISTFCEEWVASLTWENRTSLRLFLTFKLLTLLGKGETEAAELAAQMIGRSDRTIRGWRSKFFASGGELPINEQGHYQRSGMLWKDESLCKKASRFICANAALKGKPNLTVGSFCRWVNEELLPKGMSGDEMREILRKHPDFRDEKSRVERFLLERKHIPYMLPKFHPELNLIERVWAQAKRYAGVYCKYTLPALRSTINPALDSVPLVSIQKHFQKVRHYMFAYLEGADTGSVLEDTVKQL